MKREKEPWWLIRPWVPLMLIGIMVSGVWYLLGVVWPGAHGNGAGSGAGTFGDQFGAVNALFSGLAFGFLIFELALQRRELQDQRVSRDRQTEHITLQTEQLREAQSIQQRMMEADAISQAVRFPVGAIQCNRIQTTENGVTDQHLSANLPLGEGATRLTACFDNSGPCTGVERVSLLLPRADRERGEGVSQEILIEGNPTVAELWFLARAPNGLDVYYRFDLDPFARLFCVDGPCGWEQVPEGVCVQIIDMKAAVEDQRMV